MLTSKKIYFYCLNLKIKKNYLYINVKIQRSLGLVAVLYFTANFSAQNVKNDTVNKKETAIEEVVMID